MLKKRNEILEQFKKEEDPIKAQSLFDQLKDKDIEVVTKINYRVNQLQDQIQQLTSQIEVLTQKKDKVQKEESECKSLLIEKKNSGILFRKNDFLKWNTGDVVTWLGTLEGGKFVKYAKFFYEGEVNGKVLKDMTREELQIIGVKSLSDNRQLFDAITSLRNTPSAQPLIHLETRPLTPNRLPTSPSPIFSFVVPGTGTAEKIQIISQQQQDLHRFLFIPVPALTPTSVDVLLSSPRTLTFQSSADLPPPRSVTSGVRTTSSGSFGTSVERTVPSGSSRTSASTSRGSSSVPLFKMFNLPFDITPTDLTLDGTTVILHYEHLIQKPPLTLVTPGGTNVPAESGRSVLSYLIPGVRGGDKPEIRPRLNDHQYIFESVPGGMDAKVTVELPDSRTVLFRVHFKEVSEEEKQMVHVFSLAFDVTESLLRVEGTDVVLIIP